ncbi:MAG: circadian clock protein KaiB [Anaerolineae bacterium]|nr:circadian clock protein KaiB [Anaerolineae bacterium]
MTVSQPAAGDEDGIIVFRLYIAAGAPNSLRAQTTLRRLCDTYLPDRHRIEIIDVLAEPRRALADHILVTPALIKVSPPPSWQMTGDLSATSKILLALGIQEGS